MKKCFVSVLLIALILTACQPAVYSNHAPSSTASPVVQPTNLSVSTEPSPASETTTEAAEISNPSPSDTGPIKIHWQVKGLKFIKNIGETIFAESINPDRPYDNATPVSIHALDHATGRMLWSSETKGRIIGANRWTVYVATSPQRLTALDSATGVMRWQMPLDANVRPAERGLEFWDRFISQTVDAILLAVPGSLGIIDGSSGNLIEQFAYPNEEAPFLLMGNRLIELRAEQIQGYALDQRTYVWDLPGLKLIGICGDLLITTDLYADSRDGASANNVQAVNASDGRIIWRADLTILGPECLCKSSVNLFLSNDQPYFASDQFLNFPSDGTSITALDLASGSVLWTAPTGLDFLGSTHTVVIFGGQGLTNLRAYDTRTGRLLWENPNIALQSINGSIGDVVIGEDKTGDAFIGLDSRNGKELWRFTNRQVYIVGNSVLIGAIDQPKDATGGITLIDPTTGTELDSIDSFIGDQFRATDDGVILYSSYDSRFAVVIPEQTNLPSLPAIPADQLMGEVSPSFSPDTWTVNIPPEVTPRALRYYGVGPEIYPLCPEGEQKPRMDRGPGQVVDRFTSLPILSCGWGPQETITVTIRSPNGSETQHELLPWNKDLRTGEEVWRFDFSPALEEPAGKYDIFFQGKSGEIHLEVWLAEPDRPLVIQLEQQKILLYNFLPNETVRLIAYSDTKFLAWQEYQVNANGQLLIPAVIPKQGMGYVELFALGEQSQNWEKDRITITCPNALTTRLGVGIQARVTFTDGQPLNLRQEPGSSGTVIAKIPEGTEITIDSNAGPHCVDDMLWWYVQYAGQSGWVAEGLAEGYDQWFLEPLEFPNS